MTSDHVREALKWLGPTAADVAANLQRRRIKGIPREGYACPLHRYLESLGMESPFHVTNENVHGSFVCPIKLPRACQAFVRQFDRGKYPELEKKRKKR